MDAQDKKLITIDEAIEYAQAMAFQFKNSGRIELTAEYIEDTIRDFSNWKHKDIIKLFAKKFKNKRRKTNR